MRLVHASLIAFAIVGACANDTTKPSSLRSANTASSPSLARAAARPLPKVPAEQQVAFADLPWGIDGEDVKRVLLAKGFAFDSVDAEGDLRFSGVLADRPARIGALMANQRLAKISVNIITPDNKAREVYREMATTLEKKYGRPSKKIETYISPYYAGDGYEDQAIRQGKGFFFKLWNKDGPLGPEVLGLHITEALTVSVAYEAPAWESESDRRKAVADEVF
jgi:hypothetical protein